MIITPHVGGQAAWRNDKITDLFCRNLVRWKQGQPLINFLADKRLGFPIRGGGYPLWGEAGIKMQRKSSWLIIRKYGWPLLVTPSG